MTKAARPHRAPAAALRSAALLCCALSLPLAGCSGIPYSESAADGPYGSALKHATRRAALIDTLETRAFVRLVHVSPELAAMQAERLSALRGEGPAESAARRERARADASAPTFLAVVFTPHPEWNDWGAKGSSWRIALDAAGGQVEPASVQRFERPFPVELTWNYPFIDDFHVAYRLQFPAGTPSQAAHLTVAGVLGKLEFDWKDE